MKFVVGQDSRVREGLPDVFFLEVRQFRDDLRRRHAICDEVNDVCDGDSKATDRRSPSEYMRVLRNPIEGVCHDLPPGSL